MTIPFVFDHDPRYGEAVEAAPLIRRVTAKNPGKFSGLGTGTYIVGRGDVVVIDPGPTLNSHRDALMAALRGERVSTILVTHCHSDHSPLAAWLRETTGAPTVAFGPHVENPDWVNDDDEPYVPDEEDLAAKAAAEADGMTEEGHDLAFVPDRTVAHGEVAAQGDGWTITAVHTPGHTSNHLCYFLREHGAMFTGDHIMGWSTSVITPPDGDMRDYLASLATVRALAPTTLWPTHGAPVTDPAPFIDAFIEHRLERERNILACVREGEALIPDIVRRLYVGVNEKLYRAAARSVLAHMIKLVEDGSVRYEGAHPGVKTPYLPV
jgi:glyoxylase-like metal-dependent hydrolase (beta-lactamase superfamily II)